MDRKDRCLRFFVSRTHTDLLTHMSIRVHDVSRSREYVCVCVCVCLCRFLCGGVIHMFVSVGC